MSFTVLTGLIGFGVDSKTRVTEMWIWGCVLHHMTSVRKFTLPLEGLVQMFWVETEDKYGQWLERTSYTGSWFHQNPSFWSQRQGQGTEIIGFWGEVSTPQCSLEANAYWQTSLLYVQKSRRGNYLPSPHRDSLFVWASWCKSHFGKDCQRLSL